MIPTLEPFIDQNLTVCPHAYKSDDYWTYRHEKVDIRSSMVANVVGSGYKTRYKQYLEDIAEDYQPEDLSGNYRVQWGVDHESTALAAATPLFEEMGFRVHTDMPLVHRAARTDVEFEIGSTVDAMLTLHDENDRVCRFIPVEIKCPDPQRDDNPYATPALRHLMQMHIHMHVWGTDTCYFISWHPSKTYVRRIHFNEHLWEGMFERMCFYVAMKRTRNMPKVYRGKSAIEVSLLQDFYFPLKEKESCYCKTDASIDHSFL